MTRQYPVHVDSKGYVLIPSEVRKEMGLEPRSILLLSQEGGEIRLIPGEIRPKREIRMYTNEEIAQALIDSGVTPEGLVEARQGIIELGLNPDDFHPNF